MGMAASQARLLSITARLTNNENSGQSISYAKQRLADQTLQLTNEYNEALEATKLTVLTGFNGAEAVYTDISYSLMTGLQMAENTKQYIVTDTKGRILVTADIANAYEKSNGNYNQFLANLTGSTVSKNGMAYSQSDLSVNRNNETWEKLDKDGNQVEADPSEPDAYDTNSKTLDAKQKIHEAWDAYFATVGINLGDEEHDFGFSWNELYATNEHGEYIDKNGQVIPKDEDSDKDGINDSWSAEILAAQGTTAIGCGYAGYARTEQKPLFDEETGDPVMDEDGNQAYYTDYVRDADGNIIYDPINYEGTTDESRKLYDYAMSLTEAYLRVNRPGETNFNTEFNADEINIAANSENTTTLNYYRNIFTKMQSNGYFTYTSTPAEADENHIYADEGTGTAGTVQKSPLYDNITFEKALRDGSLRLEYYSTTDKEFVSTTIAEDNCIQEVADERAIAKAESKYNQDMTALENKDKKLDLELKKLDTEHSALQTEYDSVKNVVDKNVEASFKTFG